MARFRDSFRLTGIKRVPVPLRPVLASVLLALVANSADAQVIDTARIPMIEEAQAPITPRRAFLYSLVLPGAGQAKLNRSYAGASFVLVEAVALTLVHRSAEDLRIARRFHGDSMPLSYQTNTTTGLVARDTLGNPIVSSWQQSRYTTAYVRTRRLHLEDWMALLVFNHLFSGADAFVAAQLWDLPARIGVNQSANGTTTITATIPFGGPPRR
jgi:hypothetical protein